MGATTEPPRASERTGVLLDPRRWMGRVFSGGWVDAPMALEVVEPATGDVLGLAGAADATTVAAATAVAARAQRAWAETPLVERVAVIRRAAGLLERHRPEIEGWVVRETGATPARATQEITASVGQLDQAAALVAHPLGLVLPSLTPGRSSTARRVPVGVVGVICPWSIPLVLAMRSIAPALALGNAVVLKADPNTPVSGGVIVARLLEEAGLPDGVLHAFAGGADAGQALAEDPHVRMISFTGSTATGREVGQAAGRTLKRTVLELGGNSAFVVLDDADVDVAASAGAWASFLHQGQICLAASRHLVHESITEAYLDALVARARRLAVGNPATEDVALGPIINQRQVDRVQRIVDESIAQGAAALAGGKPDGPFFPPTVLADVIPGMPAFAEEICGPVAPVVPFSDDDEAVALANATEYGLSAAVQSGSPDRAARVADRLKAGMVHVNDQTVNEEPPAPFGGFGASSNGARFGGVASLDLWTEWQWRTARDRARAFPF
ncbi:aldehyde dehydrogenase family protein [Capillimicrobium parvum]|uniref:Benzaldehyde dehydrogenase [NAD(+)] n=1 Tax=Capillimicrobium parvum TaxID=2884022 RepID=A0A9E6XTV9_9ACTN|nr:aldehyde dehydrogenase family protein [Capillimicrobium parvum]UGS34301.1 Benzaldehyde dehydrogenase [NAD(+)] [Capillimicrobium parvum]